MASDQGNLSAFSCATGGKKRQTPGEGNSSSLGKEISFCAGDGGQAEPSPCPRAWLSPSPALAAVGEGAPRAGDLQSCAAPRSFPSPFFCFAEDPGRTWAVGSELLREGTRGPGVRLSLVTNITGEGLKLPKVNCKPVEESETGS